MRAPFSSTLVILCCLISLYSQINYVCTRTLLEKRKHSVVNVVVTTDLKQPIDLEEMTKLKDIIYDSSKYQGRVAYFKSKKMQGKVIIFFSTGKLISVGTTSEKQAKKELELVVKSLIKAKIIEPTMTEPVVRNVVISIDLGKPVDLVALCDKMQRLIYEPEQFPAAIWRGGLNQLGILVRDVRYMS